MARVSFLAVASSTRPITAVLSELRPSIHGMVHCSGGAQTKILNFVEGKHVIKDNLFDVPPLFDLIRRES